MTFAIKINTTGIYDPIKKVFRTNNNPFIIKGTHDIIGIHNAIYFSIEVKSAKGKVSDGQLSFQNKIESCGGMSRICRSLDECVEFFREVKKYSSILNKV